MDDVIEFNVPDLVKRMENASMDEAEDIRWFQNHGAVRIDPEACFNIFDEPSFL